MSRPSGETPRLEGVLLPRDFMIAAVLVLAANFLFCGVQPERPARNLSYHVRLAEIGGLDPEPPVDLVIYGDSRSKALVAERLCAELKRPRGRCLNLSSTAGDWVTVWGLHERIAPLLAEDAIVIVAVSEFWLELGGHNSIGLLQNAPVYAAMGEPLSTLESYLPLSRNRADRMRDVRGALEATGARVRDAFGVEAVVAKAPVDEDEPLAPVMARNLDRWFRPASAEDLARNRARGRAVLELVRTGAEEVRLLYLPNPKRRDAFVDRSYPGRRQRFFDSLRKLAEASEVELIDLSSALPEFRDYRDYHHLNEGGVRKATRLLARSLGS